MMKILIEYEWRIYLLLNEEQIVEVLIGNKLLSTVFYKINGNAKLIDHFLSYCIQQMGLVSYYYIYLIYFAMYFIKIKNSLNRQGNV